MQPRPRSPGPLLLRRPRVPPQRRRALRVVASGSLQAGATSHQPAAWVRRCGWWHWGGMWLGRQEQSNRPHPLHPPPGLVGCATVRLHGSAARGCAGSRSSWLRSSRGLLSRPFLPPALFLALARSVSLLGNVLMVNHSPSPRLTRPAVAGPCRRLTTARHLRRLRPCSPVPLGLRSRPILRPHGARSHSAPVTRAGSSKKLAPLETVHVARQLTQLPRRLKSARPGLVLASSSTTGPPAWGRCAWSLLTQFFGPQQLVDPPLGLAPDILFLVMMQPAIA